MTTAAGSTSRSPPRSAPGPAPRRRWRSARSSRSSAGRRWRRPCSTTVGPWGAVFLRSAFGALALLALARGRLPRAAGGPAPRRRPLRRLALAALNLCFYAALDRLPLGIAVTLEFVGPLGVAVFGSRRPARPDLGAAGRDRDPAALRRRRRGDRPLGAALALAAGGFWAAYILLSARVGGRFPAARRPGASAAISAVLVAPFGIAQGGGELLTPATLAIGLAVGLLSSAFPFALEFEALRRLPNAVFGVLMSLEPAVAAAGRLPRPLPGPGRWPKSWRSRWSSPPAPGRCARRRRQHRAMADCRP